MTFAIAARDADAFKSVEIVLTQPVPVQGNVVPQMKTSSVALTKGAAVGTGTGYTLYKTDVTLQGPFNSAKVTYDVVGTRADGTTVTEKFRNVNDFQGCSA